MNKKTIITALLALIAMAGQGQEITGRVMLTDSIDYLLSAKSKDQHGVLVLML